MFNTFRSLGIRVLVAGALILPAYSQPVVNAALNAASYALPGLPNSSIAQGSLFILFGTNMGPTTLAQVQALPLPTAAGLAGTSVKVTSGGTALDCPMFYTSATQIAAILPSNTPLGNATITVTYNGATSATRAVTVVASSFGIYTINSRGTGAGIITDTNYRILAPNFSVKPGDAVVIWGTGLGAVTTPDSQAPVQTDLTNIPAQTYIGGKLATRLYAGRAPYPAEDQIVVTVPAGVTEGCTVSVVVKIGNVVSNLTTMPISSNSSRVCTDANGISDVDYQGLLSKSSFNLGSVSLQRSAININAGPAGTFKTTSDTGSANFATYTPASITAGGSFSGYASLNSCIVLTQSSANPPTNVGPLGSTVGLDAGALINVKGNVSAKTLTPVSGQKGLYSGTLASAAPLFLDQTSYAIDNGSGGVDVKGFTFNVNGITALTWNELATAGNNPIVRANGVTVTWTGGTPGTFATITGISATSGTPTVSAIFICEAPVEAKSFTVGPEILLQLPASASVGGVPTGFLLVGNTSAPLKFTAPGLDYGFFTFSSSNGAGVSYQ